MKIERSMHRYGRWPSGRVAVEGRRLKFVASFDLGAIPWPRLRADAWRVEGEAGGDSFASFGVAPECTDDLISFEVQCDPPPWWLMDLLGKWWDWQDRRRNVFLRCVDCETALPLVNTPVGERCPNCDGALVQATP